MKRQRFKSDDDESGEMVAKAMAIFKDTLPAAEFEKLGILVEEGRLKLTGPQPILDKIARAKRVNSQTTG